jgi:hypothetical protein
MRTTYYGLLLTVLLSLGVGAGCWAPTFLGWRSALGPVLPALFVLYGTVALAEGLALGLDWKGSARQFQALKDSGNLSAVDRLLTWELGRPILPLATWYRILGWYCVAAGVSLLAVVALR